MREVINEFRSRLVKKNAGQEVKDILLDLARETLLAENEHILSTSEVLLEKTRGSMEQILRERLDILDTFFEGLESGDEENAQPRRPQEILEELSNLVRTQLHLSTDELRRLASADRDVKEIISNQISAGLTLLAITRLIGAFERRLDDSLDMRSPQLIDLEWSEISAGLMQALRSNLEKRLDSLLSSQGQISQNIDTAITRMGDFDVEDESDLVDLLMSMSIGSRMAIDPRTHQRVMRRVTLLNYIFLAAQSLMNVSSEHITEEILEHLEDAQQRLEVVWGKMEFERFRLADLPLANLEAQTRQILSEALGEDQFAIIEPKKVDELSESESETLATVLGRRIQNGIYRHILVSVISELWVDYLTRMEGLRVYIGLEAFAQRDPLVQYKSQATEMFKNLLSEIRVGVISRMFLFQPRRAAAPGNAEKAVQNLPTSTVQTPAQETGEHKKKRKRH